MSRLLDQIKKSVKTKTVNEEFKSDDGVSTVPDAILPGGPSPADMAKKVKSKEKAGIDEPNVDEDNKKIKSTKTDLGTNKKKPEIWGEGKKITKTVEVDDDDDDDNSDSDDDDDDKDDQSDDSDDDSKDDDDDGDGDSDNKFTARKVTKADVDTKEHLDALLGGESLTEEFKSRTKTIFETAVIAAANKVVGEIVEEITAEKAVTEEAMLEVMIEKLDTYLDKVVSEWLEDNRVEVEHNVRSDLAESFLTGLKVLFDDHYVTIDEEKVDVVEELIKKVESLESSLDEEINKNVSLAGRLSEARKDALVVEHSAGLSENEKERLLLLSEGVDFESEENFISKINEIKDAYFKPSIKVSTVRADDTPIELEEDEVTSRILTEGQAYAKDISKRLGKFR